MLIDAVIAGHDREYVAALAWLDPEEAGKRAAPRATSRSTTPCCEQACRAAGNLSRNAGSASRVERLLLLDEPPDIDAGEITDKGYINQRAVLERRADAVERLFSEPPDPAVIAAAG